MLTKQASIGMSPPNPIGEDLISHWLLDPAIRFLNHGCFGATPKVVLEAQTALRRRIESRPVEVLDRGRDPLLQEAKQAVGEFIGAAPEDLGFVTNATGGVNAVVRSLSLGPADEVVTTNHAYSAIRQTLRFVSEHYGPKVVEACIDLPIRSPQTAVEAVAATVGPRTRLVVIDHITSPTAVLLPIARIIELCAERGVDVLVDGAHAPGMIELDVPSLNAAYYTGNLHKWVCAPKGAAFLWVRPDRQKHIHPNTISHFLNQGLAEEFSWQGTRDITAWLCAKDAIDFMARFGWERVRRHNHELATWAQSRLSRLWKVEPATPLDGSMLGSMATVPLPEAAENLGPIEELQARLYRDYRIEAPVIEFQGRRWIRVSCQIYNTAEQYQQLGEAVLEMIQ